ncbi:hypothetical protein [Burkholderia glumae]|uniref:Uncharacterized protein n=1 Tax=Burkholderia glumae TaxID=337 RepID=A0AAP9Y0L4_BURGL|nr:hypothetical protein [Burkholderia glumae]MCM2482095.1 hypothetical protein [Burkholderia glumae]MCM2507762.1 hypothetical protein [Burkholderia glumae]MCM2536268.1 hypothetical protein [Burkholderia glumae]MCM2548905.1 hypothetical protein [Burkholderia glumae]NVE23392.1 hypothetical protein [Burkholderia glumae]
MLLSLSSRKTGLATNTRKLDASLEKSLKYLIYIYFLSNRGRSESDFPEIRKQSRPAFRTGEKVCRNGAGGGAHRPPLPRAAAEALGNGPGPASRPARKRPGRTAQARPSAM